MRLRRQARDQLVDTRHRQELSAVQAELALATGRAAAAAAELSGAAGAPRAATPRRWRALHDMWLGYPAPYTDDLELTYLVGLEASGDRVIEHRRTTPDPGAALPCLESRLTTPTELDADGVTLADVEMVTRSEDDRIVDPADRAHREAQPAALPVRVPAEHHRADAAGTRATGCAACGTCCGPAGTTC